MATATKTWDFLSNQQSWTTVNGSNATTAWQTGGGSPASGCIESTIAGRTVASVTTWQIAGTWETLFGIATGQTVTQVGTPSDYSWTLTTYTTGSRSTSGAFNAIVAGVTKQLSAPIGSTGTTAWARAAGSSVAISDLGSSVVTFALLSALATGNSSSARVTMRQDTVTVTITYSATPAAAGSSYYADYYRREVLEA